MAPRYWIVILAIALAIIAGAMFLGGPDPVPETETTAVPPPEPAPVPALPEPAPEPEPPAPEPVAVEPEPEPLPDLDASDAFVRAQSEGLSASESIDQILSADQLIRRFTAVVENLAQGTLPREPVAFLTPAEKFAVLRRDDRLYLDPASFDRYDRASGIVAALDPSQAVALLRLTEPLMEEAYAELGLRDVDVEDRLARAIDVLLSTPDPQGMVELKQPSVMYEFADPRLEALQPVQKLLIRVGPENRARIKGKLREIRALLALD
ncbi:MAG: DUF3014 domain-containing protein [Pseudomonadales bacterium]|jgi:hypothetical protein|nr:DUF3014 domain-containing protein [Pseudomonadales bacterium]